MRLPWDSDRVEIGINSQPVGTEIINSGREDTVTATEISNEVRGFRARTRGGTLVHETIHALLRTGEAERRNEITLNADVRNVVDKVERELNVFKVVVGVAAAERRAFAAAVGGDRAARDQTLEFVDEELFATSVGLRVAGRDKISDNEVEKLRKSLSNRAGIRGGEKREVLEDYIRASVNSYLTLQEGRDMR